jgi:chromosome segregation ATPase
MQSDVTGLQTSHQMALFKKQSEFDQMKLHVASLTEQLQLSQSADGEKFRAENEELTQTVAAVSKNLENANHDIVALKDQISQKDVEFEQLRSDLTARQKDAMNESIRSLQLEKDAMHAQLEGELKALQLALQRKEAECSKISTESKGSLDQLKSVHAALQENEKEIETLDQAHKTVETTLKSAHVELSRYQELFNAKTAECVQLQAELKDARNLTSLSSATANPAEVTRLKEQIAALQKQLDESSEVMMREVVKLSREAGEARKELEAELQHKEDLIDQLQSL